MASLYDSASLVMIPSGYKDDKLYSIKPTNGDGDFTFSRDGAGASPATRVNASGLIEKGRENFVTYSEDFSQWTAFGAATLTTGVTDPNGGNTAATISNIPSGNATDGLLLSNIPMGISANSVVCQSIYMKGSGTIVLAMERAITGTYFFFVQSFTLTSEWQRFDFFKVIPNAATGFSFYITNYSGTTATSVDIAFAQFEFGIAPTEYIPTNGSSATAGLLGDMPRLDYSGGATCPSLLLEPSRVNVLPQSEYFGGSEWTKTNTAVTTNASTSPEGVQNASLVYPTASSSTKWGVKIEENISGIANADYTNSVYVKANGWQWIYMIDSSGLKNVWFDLVNGVVGTEEANATGDIEPMGNDWYKCTIYSHTSPTTYTYAGVYFSDADNSYVCTASGTNGVYMYAFQSEAGSYPTSYIPTYGSASTRARDNASTIDVSSLGVTTGYTLFYELGEFDLDATTWIIQRNANSDYLFQEYGNTAIISTINGSVYPFSHGVSGTRFKVAIAFDGTNINVFTDGVKRGSWVASSDWSSFGLFEMDYNAVRTNWKQLAIFPTSLTDAECIALTTL